MKKVKIIGNLEKIAFLKYRLCFSPAKMEFSSFEEFSFRRLYLCIRELYSSWF
jgi:hypothetical protein